MRGGDSDEEKENDYKYDYKIVLIGEPKVGKTCIIKYFINKSFNSNEKNTLSGSFFEKVIELEEFAIKIKFEIWDTVGGERYKSMTNLFFRNSKAAIIVYDITDYKTFEEIKNYWYEKIKEVEPKGKSLLFFKFYIFYYSSHCNCWK